MSALATRNGTSHLPRFDSLFSDFWSDLAIPVTAHLPVDLREDDDKFVIEADVPGLSKDDITVDLDNRVLTIASKRSSNSESKKDGYSIRERRWGSASRAFRLPDNIDPEGVSAAVDNGVLTVEVRKQEQLKRRKIEVKTG